jgi:hypothetical protein
MAVCSSPQLRTRARPYSLVVQVLCVIGYFASVRNTLAAPSRTAQQLLDLSGVRGGFAVHAGCGDARLAIGLARNEGFLVHGLAGAETDTQQAREQVQAAGLYGRVAIDTCDGRSLPYVDGLVNLLIVDDALDLPKAEITRVLAPGGVALLGNGTQWRRLDRPRPSDIDEWPHFLYNAGNNAVSRDTVVGPPAGMRWTGGPRWARHHDHLPA